MAHWGDVVMAHWKDLVMTHWGDLVRLWKYVVSHMVAVVVA